MDRGVAENASLVGRAVLVAQIKARILGARNLHLVVRSIGGSRHTGGGRGRVADRTGSVARHRLQCGEFKVFRLAEEIIDGEAEASADKHEDHQFDWIHTVTALSIILGAHTRTSIGARTGELNSSWSESQRIPEPEH